MSLLFATNGCVSYRFSPLPPTAKTDEEFANLPFRVNDWEAELVLLTRESTGPPRAVKVKVSSTGIQDSSSNKNVLFDSARDQVNKLVRKIGISAVGGNVKPELKLIISSKNDFDFGINVPSFLISLFTATIIPAYASGYLKTDLEVRLQDLSGQEIYVSGVQSVKIRGQEFFSFVPSGWLVCAFSDYRISFFVEVPVWMFHASDEYFDDLVLEALRSAKLDHAVFSLKNREGIN